MQDAGILRRAPLPSSAALCNKEQGRRAKEIGVDGMIVMGLDPSLTSTGIVLLNDGQIEIARTTKNQPDIGTVARVLAIVKEIEKIINHPNIPPDLVVIEGFSFGSTGRSLFDTAYLGWRIRESLESFRERDNIPWIEVSPAQLKQFATGKGNAPKEVVLQQVYKRWGVELRDNNQADAFTLAKIGEAYLRYPQDRLPDFQLGVIQALKGEKPPKKPRKKVKSCSP